VAKALAGSKKAPGIKLGIIGCGNMGRALLEGLLSQKVLPRRHLLVSDVEASVSEAIQRQFKVKATDNRQLAAACQVLVVAVKPHQVGPVLEEVKECLSRKTLIFSLAAGVSTRFLERTLAPERIGVVRLMPNILVKIRQGVIAYCPGRYATGVDLLVKRIFSPLGKVIKIKESQMDTFTAISGSGPGYLFYLAELLEEIARKRGFSQQTVREIIATQFTGTGLMLAASSQPAKTLKEKVCSPGGTTLAGLAVLEQEKLSSVLEKAIQAAEKRSRQLTR